MAGRSLPPKYPIQFSADNPHPSFAAINENFLWIANLISTLIIPGAASSGAILGYNLIQNQGVAITARSTINVIGLALVASDDNVNKVTKITLGQSPASSTSVVGVDRIITTTSPLTGTGDLSANRTLGLAGLSTIGTALYMLRVNVGATAWEYRSPSQVLADIAAVSSTRNINTTAPLAGGGDLTADRTLNLMGLSTFGAANQIIGANNAANALEYKSVVGTTDQISVTQSVNQIQIGFGVHSTINTTDATVTTLSSFTTASDKAYLLTWRVVARRTGGAAGSADDSAAFIRSGLYKNVASVVSLVGTLVDGLPPGDQHDQAWTIAIDISGANVRSRVTGAANNNVTWDEERFVQVV